MLEQRAFQCLTIPPSSNRIPDLKPAILISASMDRSSFAAFKPHLGMQPPKTLIFNICRTNSNGQHYQQYRFNGRSSSLLFNASTNPNAKPLQNLFMNGSPISSPQCIFRSLMPLLSQHPQNNGTLPLMSAP